MAVTQSSWPPLMGILGIGVDVAKISRIAGWMRRRTAERVAARILSDEESNRFSLFPPGDHCNSVDVEHIIRFLSVRFSVKEAAYKALYPVVRPTWKELTYRSGDMLAAGTGTKPKPSLLYHPSTVEGRAKIGKIFVSVSHEEDCVFASVLVETP